MRKSLTTSSIVAKLKDFRKFPSWFWGQFKRYWRRNWWHKTVTILVVIVLFCTGTMYGIARWYMWSERNTPFTMGVTFIPDYASYLGVDPQQTLDAIINDLHVTQFRFVSYWSDIEPSPGKYDFSQLDWQFAKANKAHAKVTLAVGLRQPRWPECHAPNWVDTTKPDSQWTPQLNKFMVAVINRYKDNPALQSYQLENEFYNHFGDCNNFDRNRLDNELSLVRQTDPNHPVIITRSNNYVGFSISQPLPDEIGISVYRRVWSDPINHYFQYPFPAWYYGFLAGTQKLLTGKNSILHELQAEPWPPAGQTIKSISLAEADKTFNASELAKRVQFAKATGLKTVDLWGVEYWYYRDVVLHDPSVWNTAKQLFND